MEGGEWGDDEWPGAPWMQNPVDSSDKALVVEGEPFRPTVPYDSDSGLSEASGYITHEHGTSSVEDSHSSLRLEDSHSGMLGKIVENKPRKEPKIPSASVTVVHDVNNYLIGTERPSNASLPMVNPTPGVLSNKQNIRVCQRYLQKDYSCLEKCHRFHVCLSWILDKCSNKECTKDHSFSSVHNVMLARSFLTSTFTVEHLRDALKRNHEWFRGKVNQYEREQTICPYYVLNRCSWDDCRNLHLDTTFSWEIEVNDMWIPFPRSQMDYIEECYCNPNVESAYLCLQPDENISEEEGDDDEEGDDKEEGRELGDSEGEEEKKEEKEEEEEEEEEEAEEEEKDEDIDGREEVVEEEDDQDEQAFEIDQEKQSEGEDREQKEPEHPELHFICEKIGTLGPVMIDFEKMTLSNNYLSYNVRRRSTPSDIMSDIGACTRWLWHWQRGDTWWFCRQALINKYSEIALSDFFEKQLQCGGTEIPHPNGDILNLRTLTIFDATGNLKGKLRRRPAKLFQVNTTNKRIQRFTDTWLEGENNDALYTNPEVPVGGTEFLFVAGMIHSSLQGNILAIQRIQNTFLWKAYQLKKKKMTIECRGNPKSLKEQYLFHGTKGRFLTQIFQGNLDWRLYGTNKGYRYGKGTYFANSAYFSNMYTKRNGVRIILVAMVLIGDACLGTSSTDFPPKNSATDRPFDTTVNKLINPTTFVKYNNDDYYPAYAVYYTV